MARRELIGNQWTREERNAINDNFKELYNMFLNNGFEDKEARNKAEQAVADAIIAKETANTTREEMLQIIREQTQNGDLAPEITQARGEHETVGERLNSFDAQMAQVVTLIDNYPLIEPEVSDGPRIQRAIDDVHSRGGGTIKLPHEYTSNQTLVIRGNVKLIGENREISKIIFDGVSGIDVEERTDNFAIEDITIEGLEDTLDTTGINVDYYSSYYQIRNVNVNNFGAWGVKVGGGIKWAIEEVDFQLTGRNASDPKESGSLCVTVANDDYTLRSVEGRVLNCYARGGGQYALKLYRPTDIYVNGYIAEYHEQALYAENSGGLMFNFYHEANKSSNGDIIHLHNSPSLVIFGGARTTTRYGGEEILYTFSDDIARQDRYPSVKIVGQDINARKLSIAQIDFAKHVSTEPVEGSIRYDHTNKNMLIYNGEFWEPMDNNREGTFAGETSFDLGDVNKRTFVELEITMQTESAFLYSHRSVYIRTNSYGEAYNVETVLNAGELGSVDVRLDGTKLILDMTGAPNLTTYYNIKINNLYGKRYVNEF